MTRRIGTGYQTSEPDHRHEHAALAAGIASIGRFCSAHLP